MRKPPRLPRPAAGATPAALALTPRAALDVAPVHASPDPSYDATQAVADLGLVAAILRRYGDEAAAAGRKRELDHDDARRFRLAAQRLERARAALATREAR